MGQECLKVLKYMMFAFNLIFWVAGCSVIAIGIYFVINNIYGSLLPQSPSLSIGNALIVIGCIIMVFGFIGCMGAIKENKCLLLTFFILLLIILIIEVVMAVVLYIYEKQLDNQAMQLLTSSFEQQKRDPLNNSTSHIWHDMQIGLQCCGVNGTKDWKASIPSSCCPNNACSQSNYFNKGCSDALRQWFENNFLYVGVVTICISVVEVLGMSFALTLYCHISKNSVSLPSSIKMNKQHHKAKN
ncbi:leukocyte surface antigen CD53 [Spea bombifrons]|uniref:leukocyte surface antigen CD53 n=1 Tax=Spea bombifrons TaxID=233779 RepID=UPI002349F944|nr:leukocyte surface antigen CD53 [Spea bombifrons]